MTLGGWEEEGKEEIVQKVKKRIGGFLFCFVFFKLVAALGSAFSRVGCDLKSYRSTFFSV